MEPDSQPFESFAPPPASQADWEQRVSNLLDRGQTFLAQDLADGGLARYPGSVRLRVSRALALMRTGATGDALATLDPILARFAIDETPFETAFEALREAVQQFDRSDGQKPSRKGKYISMARLVTALDEVRGKQTLIEGLDGPTLGLLGELYGEAWRQTGDKQDLQRAHDLSLAAFNEAGDRRCGVDAGVAAWLLGRKAVALKLARDVLAAPQGVGLDGTGAAGERARFEAHAIEGMAALLLGRGDAAAKAYGRARAELSGHLELVVPALRHVQRLRQHGLDVSDAVFEALRPPRVVVFTGHMMDRPGQPLQHLGPAFEAPLKAELHRRLDEMDVQIGYSSAACGSDLLFIEAMLERAAEVNIILPFDHEDFVAACVAYAGPRWIMRFRNALRLAHSVSYATTERYLGHDTLYRFANQMLHGMATLRARFLETEPHLLAVWDMSEGSLIGGAADFIDQWEDIARLQIVDPELLSLGDTVAGEPLPANATPMPVPVKVEPERVTRVMLFADLVGFSKLGEGSIPAYMAMLGRLKSLVDREGARPLAINTWGDAMFVVMERASDLVDYALRLKGAVRALAGESGGLGLQIRVSLHAGPVFPGIDPFQERPNFYGAHINRAARLEPVTVPGQIYATQQFVALLTAEESALASEARSEGGAFRPPWICEYVGVLMLAKKFGNQPVYHIREAGGAGRGA